LTERGHPDESNRVSDAPSDPTKAVEQAYLQLLVSEWERGDLTCQLHLRFQQGDESFRFLHRGQLKIGRFSSDDARLSAIDFVDRCQRSLAEFLRSSNRQACGLRPEDSGDFMTAVLTGAIPRRSAQRKEYAVTVAIASAEGVVRAGELEFDAPPELPEGVADFLSEYQRLGTIICQPKRDDSPSAAARSDRKPWWQFW